MKIGDTIISADQEFIVRALYDLDGEETDQPDLAISFIAESSSGKWFAGEVDSFEVMEGS